MWPELAPLSLPKDDPKTAKFGLTDLLLIYFLSWHILSLGEKKEGEKFHYIVSTVKTRSVLPDFGGFNVREKSPFSQITAILKSMSCPTCFSSSNVLAYYIALYVTIHSTDYTVGEMC